MSNQQAPVKDNRTTLLIYVALLVIVILVMAIWRELNPIRYTVIAKQGMNYFVVVDKSITTDKAELRKISDNICNTKDFCYIFFWDDESKASISLPMTDEQVNDEVAVYDRNTTTGLDRLMICNSGSCNE